MNSREQFEAHYDDWAGAPIATAHLYRIGDTYSSPKISAAWVHWQASRAAVVVELPESRSATDAWDYKEMTVEAIEAAGLKVEP